MSLETLAHIGEFIGGIGVILSLIYVGVQIRSNTASHRTETYASTLERMSVIQQLLAGDHDSSKMYNSGLVDMYSLSQTDRVRFVWVCTELFGALEFMHFQNRENNIPTELWQRWADTTRWWLTFDGIKQWWHAKPAPFTQGFSKFIEECISAGYQEPDPQMWMDLLKGATKDEGSKPSRGINVMNHPHPRR